MANTVTVAICTIIAVSIVLLLGINPSITVLSVGLAASLAFCTVFGTPNNALLVSTGPVDRKDLMKAGAIIAIIGEIVISAIILIFSAL
ncbi:MAG: anion permease [Promethearchaeota archaeon]